MMLFPSIYAQVDYSTKSNFLNPDTLRADQKKVFWHFVGLTSEEAERVTSSQIVEEFAKIGIDKSNRVRFVKAYNFFDTDVIYHKKSCENWESMKDLKPED